MSLHTSYHADSDADDEYERSVITSPQLQTDSEASPTDVEIPSSENTPTKFGHPGDDNRSPRAVITEWTIEECLEFLTSLGLLQYHGIFRENGIVGDALIALRHDELKEMGMNSVGHRLTILKSVYELKLKQGVPFDTDHYLPLSAEQSMNENATQDDVARLIQSIRLRDEKIVAVEAELRRVADDYRRLREELLPVFKIAKDRSQPLPPPSSFGQSADNYHDSFNTTASSLTLVDQPSSKLSRSFPKRYTGGITPKSISPTHIPSIQETRTHHDNSGLDPSAAAAAASSHLSVSINGGPQHSPGIPSPTSPNTHHSQQSTLNSRTFSQPPPSRTPHDPADETPAAQSRSDRLTVNKPPTSRTDTPSSASRISRTETPQSASRTESRAGGEAPSVEIFKSFRVSWEDPCYKVLPAALKKYNIHSDAKNYALYIVYGDQERCLTMEEKPLIVFKQLEKEGRKPMFMLRKIHADNTAIPGGTGSTPNSAGLDGRQAQINLPGGVL